MRILADSDFPGLLQPLQILEAVEQALRDQAAGHVHMPQRQHVDWGNNTLLIMPAVAVGYCGIKLVSVIPDNAASGLAVTGGVMLLNDGTTGVPLALINAAELTARRTGAVGAVGVKYLTAPATRSVGIIGCGVQGAWQAIFACAVRPIADILCVARSDDSLRSFVATVQPHVPDVRIVRCADTVELLRSTDLVITATRSAEPVLPDDARLLVGKRFISVGSYKPSMQELPDCVYRLAGMLAVDSLHAQHEVGDAINPVRRGILRPTDVVPIADWVVGTRLADTSRTTVYKSVGAAMFDLYVAAALYRRACSTGVGREVAV